MAQEELQTISQPATSMLVEAGKNFSVDEVIEKFIARFSAYLLTCDIANQQKWLERVSWMVGGNYELKKCGMCSRGTITSVVSDGTLSFRNENGTTETVLSGDVIST
jgi:biotin-(acetyl-CoA carboxylase) ligase